MAWLTMQSAFEKGYLPPELHNHIPLQCKCGFEIIISDTLKKRKCVNASCPYHLAARVETILKKMKVTGVGPETALQLVQHFKMKDAIEVIPKYLKRKPKVYLWDVAKLTCIEGIDGEWTNVLRNVRSMEDIHLLPPKYRPHLEEILENAQYFEVIYPSQPETVNIAIHGELAGFGNRQNFVDECNSLELCKVFTILKGSVSSKTKFLVTEFPNDSCGKTRRARELGIQIITSEDYINFLVMRSVQLGATSEMD